MSVHDKEKASSALDTEFEFIDTTINFFHSLSINKGMILQKQK